MTLPEDKRVRLCIAGSREYAHPDFVRYYVWAMKPFISVLINGMCPRGVDLWAREAALLHEIPVEEHPADWNQHGKAAGPRRNTRMVYQADAVVAFWDTKSPGTMNIIGTAREQRKLRAVYGAQMEALL